jgi:ABC-type lipoprotein export system ATPase subunit
MIVLEDVSKIYHSRRYTIHALRDINLRIEKGEFLIVYGPSGSGKTTLLMTIAAMLRPTKGRVCIEDKDLYKMNSQDRAGFRAKNIGFIFQMFYLVPYLKTIENVALAGGAAGTDKGTAEAKELLKKLGLSERAFHKPAQLSAGEKQRVAVARALFNQPKIILADEPTGNLDSENAALVIEYLSEFHSSGGTVIMATCQMQAPHRMVQGRAQKIADRLVGTEPAAVRIIYLRNGSIEKTTVP